MLMPRIAGAVLLLMLFVVPQLQAQTLPLPTVELLPAQQEEGNWDLAWRLGLNGSQNYHKAWAQGGANTVTAVGSTLFSAVYNEGAFQYALRVDMRYGQTRQQDGQFRKSQDQILVRNQFRRRFTDERFSLTGNIIFNTQFDKGYDRNFERVLSRFLAPATLTETAGLAFDPDPYLKTTFGMSLRQTFVRDTSLSPRYGLPEDTWFRNEAGFTIIVTYDRRIMENVTYSGYLETFSNLQKSFLNTDMIFRNRITGRINNLLTTNIEFDLQYNDDITNELQIRQVLSIGLNYVIL